MYLATVSTVVVLVFAIPRAIAGDPLAGYADQDGIVTPETRAYYTAYYGLDRPLRVQFARYLDKLAHGDLGESIDYRMPVGRLIRGALPWTLLLMGTAILISSVVSYCIGLDAAWRRGETDDRVMIATHVFLHSFPDFVLALFVLIVFGVLIRVFPSSGGSTPFTTSGSTLFKLKDVLHHLVLPASTLTLSMMGSNFLVVRNVTVGVLGQDYMLLARAKGLPERLQKRRHAGRNVLLPYLNMVGLHIGFALGGALFIENVFGYPGMGTLVVHSVNALDYPVIEACFLATALLVLTANLVVDIVSVFVDPRIQRP